jgi:ABC-type multidrug transport system fused ATPase/permease subunit
MTQGK